MIMAKKGYSIPIKEKNTSNSNYLICVAYLLYHKLFTISSKKKQKIWLKCEADVP